MLASAASPCCSLLALFVAVPFSIIAGVTIAEVVTMYRRSAKARKPARRATETAQPAAPAQGYVETLAA